MSLQPSNVNPAALMHEVSAALRRGDVATAEQLMTSGTPKPEAVAAAAEAFMRNRRWADGAWLFDRISQRDVPAGIKRCLCRNLASLQIHRPAVYELLISLPKSDHCGIGTSATRHPTIISRTADGRNLALSPDNRPLDGLAAALRLLTPIFESGQSFALCGIGDGYLLHQVAQKRPKLYMDTQQCVFVLEPDAHIMLTALMIHDYTGENGPIEQPRFQWFIGPDWAHELRETVVKDLFLPCPPISLTLGLAAADIQKTLVSIINELSVHDSQARAKVEHYYATIDRSELAAVFGGHPPRRPRVLFVTTRFSTVLQYATRDAAVGFQQLGWETRVLIEPTTHHRILNTATRATLAEFKPDLIFQINHQRQEHDGMFPPALPFACWIQDHMAHLASREAGMKVGDTDFVLSDTGPLYVHDHGYPSRQMIALAKLTAPPPLLPRPAGGGDDLIFVSNASGTPQSLLETLLDRLPLPQARDAMTECVRRLADSHTAGQTLSTHVDTCRYLREIITEFGLEIAPAEFQILARAITHPIVDAFYRQQALRWAAAAAKEMGLTLALYGNGWDKHPEFSQYARGPVAPGRDLHELSRRSAINLQIVPYLCLHQRLLDGICSGAFFLIREHVSDFAPQEMLDLLETNGGGQVGRLDEARACIPPPLRDRFETLLKDCVRALCWTEAEDPIEVVRAWREAQMLVAGAGVLPQMKAVSFNDPASLRERIARFVHDPELREEITASQRESIVGRLAYAQSMGRVARRIGQLLPTQAGPLPGIAVNISTGRAA